MKKQKTTIFEFQIVGNHEDPEGNAVPYTRTLHGSHSRQGTRYFEWHDYVRGCFMKTLPKGKHFVSDPKGVVTLEHHRDRGLEKPISLENSRVRVDTAIVLVGDNYGDADNIHKGILDALFLNDKCVTTGFYDSRVGEKPVVIVKIQIMPEVGIIKNKKN